MWNGGAFCTQKFHSPFNSPFHPSSPFPSPVFRYSHKAYDVVVSWLLARYSFIDYRHKSTGIKMDTWPGLVICFRSCQLDLCRFLKLCNLHYKLRDKLRLTSFCARHEDGITCSGSCWRLSVGTGGACGWREAGKSLCQHAIFMHSCIH